MGMPIRPVARVDHRVVSVRRMGGDHVEAVTGSAVDARAGARDRRPDRDLAMTDTLVPGMEPMPASSMVDGDVGAYLEELIVDLTAGVRRADAPAVGGVVRVELAGPHLRLTGDIALGRFRRISDVINHHQGLLRLVDVVIQRRNGTPTRVVTPEMWVSPADVTLVGQHDVSDEQPAPPEVRIVKEPHPLVVVTPGHTLTGNIYVPVGAEVAVFVESDEPHFIPMTHVRARSLADRRIVTNYPFALLNRKHIVAATEMPASMQAANWRI
jgi:hypothetical protein